MDIMSPFALATVSTPEAMLTLATLLVVMDGKRRLRFNEPENILKFVFTLLIMLIQSYFVRTYSSNFVVSTLVQTTIYALIFKAVYFRDIKLKYVALGVLFYGLIILTTELGFLFTAIIFNGDSIYGMYMDDLKRLLYSSPTRVIQILIFLTAWKWHDVKEKMKSNRGVSFQTIYIIVVLIICELGIILLFSTLFGKLILSQKLFLIVILVLLSSLNVVFITSQGKLIKAVYDNCRKNMENKK